MWEKNKNKTKNNEVDNFKYNYIKFIHTVQQCTHGFGWSELSLITLVRDVLPSDVFYYKTANACLFPCKYKYSLNGLTGV